MITITSRRRGIEMLPVEEAVGQAFRVLLAELCQGGSIVGRTATSITVDSFMTGVEGQSTYFGPADEMTKLFVAEKLFSVTFGADQLDDVERAIELMGLDPITDGEAACDLADDEIASDGIEQIDHEKLEIALMADRLREELDEEFQRREEILQELQAESQRQGLE